MSVDDRHSRAAKKIYEDNSSKAGRKNLSRVQLSAPAQKDGVGGSSFFVTPIRPSLSNVPMCVKGVTDDQ